MKRALIAAILLTLLGGCQMVMHIHFTNASGAPVTLLLRTLDPPKRKLKHVKVYRGGSKLFPMGEAPDYPTLSISTARCEYLYEIPNLPGWPLMDWRVRVRLEPDMSLRTRLPNVRPPDWPHNETDPKPLEMVLRPVSTHCP